MKPKKRLTRKDPNYFIPLPYAMAVKRVIGLDEAQVYLFEGMQLELLVEGVVNKQISICAHTTHGPVIIGYVPKGMVTRIEGIMEHEERIAVTLERIQCDQLKNMFWVCIDELPGLDDLGFRSV